ncbi:hypothetical protein SAMN05216559_1816 [Halomicrobium zhouii]|uniref:Uncharacterized protein n=2 Tax=Halomicrobium zhouii TaxID=767519 RepID=A0A1I6L168_9EURY|nr:hypothetical protein SAMN05216559_1816 [Halomicrobium zhouii]
MNVVGEESRVPVLNVREGDLLVIVGFPFAGFMLAATIGIDLLIVLLSFCGLVIGSTVLFASPDHMTGTRSLAIAYRYYCKRPRTTYSVPASLSAEATEEARTACDGGLADYTPFTPDERTQDLTNIERAWPGTGAVQRSDGAMEQFIELDPDNMDFAMSGDWAGLQSIGESFANNELDFRLTMHTTTRPFPADQLVDKIDDRLDDDDVSDRPTFEALLEEYRESRPEDIEGTQQLHYYLGVEVAPYDVYERNSAEPTPAEKLARLPVVGLLFTPFVTRREQLTEAELRGRMLEALDERLRTVERELVSTASDWSSRRLSTVEVFALAVEFWNGTTVDEETAESMVRERSVVDSTPREDADV